METKTIEKWEYNEENPQGVKVGEYQVPVEPDAKPTLAELKARVDELMALVAAL